MTNKRIYAIVLLSQVVGAGALYRIRSGRVGIRLKGSEESGKSRTAKITWGFLLSIFLNPVFLLGFFFGSCFHLWLKHAYER